MGRNWIQHIHWICFSFHTTIHIDLCCEIVNAYIFVAVILEKVNATYKLRNNNGKKLFPFFADFFLTFRLMKPYFVVFVGYSILWLFSKERKKVRSFTETILSFLFFFCTSLTKIRIVKNFTRNLIEYF